MEPHGHTVLITGASRGLGEGIAYDLAARGWNVGVLGRDQSALERLVHDLVGRGARAVAVTADVTQRDDVRHAVAEVEETLGVIDGLVNNAGVQRLGAVVELSEDDWDTVVDTNLKGAFLCLQAVGERMLARGHGAIVNIASVAGLTAFPDRAAYAASKAGLLMLTRTCALEWGPAGVRVNAVAPTFVDTPLGRLTLDQPGMLESITAQIPMGRIATIDDVASAVAFLLDDTAAGFVTGEVIAVDGGLRA